MRAQETTAIENGDQDSGGSTWEHLAAGFKTSFSLWDLSILVVGLAGEMDDFFSDHHIEFPFIEFDQDLSDRIARTDGSFTLGSRIGPDHLAWTIAVARMAAVLVLDEYSAFDIQENDYRSIFFFGKAVLTNMFVTELVKSAVYRVRPDGTDARSFFSGHASATFTFTSFLYRELDDWIDSAFPDEEDKQHRLLAKGAAFTAAYGWAAYVGYSRIYDRKHYPTDVLAGAAVGTIIGNMMYSAFLSSTPKAKGIAAEVSIDPDIGTTVCIRIPL